MEFLLKCLTLINNLFTYIVGVLVIPLQLAFNDGLVATYTTALAIITWAMLTDFALGFINALINPKRKVKSKKMGDTVKKMTSVYFSFVTLGMLSLLTYETQSFHYLYLLFHPAVLMLTTLVVTREVISLIETAEDMGLPGAKQLKEKIDNIPNLFNKK